MKTILIVDDKIDFLNSLIDALKTVTDYKFIAASNSDEALKHIKNKEIDLLITDYVLDDHSLNGDDIIKIIRDREKRDNYTSFTPCILMTASEKERRMTAQLFNLNAGFYSKSSQSIPILVNLIEDKIRESLARNKVTDNSTNSEFVYPKKKSIFDNKTFKYLFLPILIGLIILFVWFYVQPLLSKKKSPQNSILVKKSENVHIALNVIDENNNPIENAALKVEGSPNLKFTDSSGYLSLNINKNNFNGNEISLNISKKGFKSIRKVVSNDQEKLLIILPLDKSK